MIKKWIGKHKWGIILGGLVSLLIPLQANKYITTLGGMLIGGYIHSLTTSKESTGRNYGFIPALANPWVIGGLLALVPIIYSLFKKPEPTFMDKLSGMSPVTLVLVILGLAVFIKMVRKKPRTIIIQETRQ